MICCYVFELLSGLSKDETDKAAKKSRKKKARVSAKKDSMSPKKDGMSPDRTKSKKKFFRFSSRSSTLPAADTETKQTSEFAIKF